MGFPRYEKYKDSGVEWLGEVPEHWDICKVRRCLLEHKQGYYSSDSYVDKGVKLLRITDLLGFGMVGIDSCPFVEDRPDLAQFLLKKDDFVFARTGGAGLFGLIHDLDEPLVFASYLIRFRFDNSIETGFLRFFFLSLYFQKALQQNIHGGVNQNIHAEDIKDQIVTMPSKPEQQIIAAFLDRETAKIDDLIAEQQKLIELLKEKRQAVISHAVTKGLNPDAKMKDSGIEWLGEVPEHWEVKRIKDLSLLISKGTTPTTVGAEFTPEGIRFIKAENISEGKVTTTPEFYISEETHAILSRSSLKDGDVLVVIAGATTGKSAIIETHLLPANTNQAVAFIRPIEKHFSFLIDNWLNTSIVKNLILLDSVQSAQPNLSMEDLGNIPITLPNIEEINFIITFIQTETSKLDTLISEAQKAITLLQERRTALISAAVTGKIDVRGFVPDSESVVAA